MVHVDDDDDNDNDDDDDDTAADDDDDNVAEDGIGILREIMFVVNLLMVEVVIA